MDAADFPYDVQWTDIDAMSSALDFTYDEQNFHGLSTLVRELQADGKHYVNIIDPAISSTQSSGTYLPFDDGVKEGIFITKFNSTELIIGKVRRNLMRFFDSEFIFVKVWPGLTAFPDFTHPNALQWWTNVVSKFHSVIPFDGMWIVRPN
jgi:alpha-glucosidase (family GH31 glycosyl hydrolase)